MFLSRGINASYRRRPWYRALAAVMPWLFVAAVAAGSLLPAERWKVWVGLPTTSAERLQREQDSETVWRRAGNPSVRHAVEVLRTIDGDTFDARVALWPGLELNTRIRLRGIDAPELHAACADELRKAEAASRALRNLLAEGEVAIFNIGPDKYGGRVVADAATRRTPNVSAALVASGHARVYLSGRRRSWCEEGR